MIEFPELLIFFHFRRMVDALDARTQKSKSMCMKVGTGTQSLFSSFSHPYSVLYVRVYEIRLKTTGGAPIDGLQLCHFAEIDEDLGVFTRFTKRHG